MRHRSCAVCLAGTQTWADTFISELNDTHVEAELRTRNIPPQLDFAAAVSCYRSSRSRLLVLGYNATLTTAVEAPRQPGRVRVPGGAGAEPGHAGKEGRKEAPALGGEGGSSPAMTCLPSC